MTAPDAAMLIVGALCLIMAMYVWLMPSNRRHHRQMERRRHGSNSPFESDLAEWIRAEREERLR